MEYNYEIYDEIFDQDYFGVGAITPKTFSEFTSELKSGDELVIHFNSPGGSVTGGIAIANKVKELSKKGVKTTAVVEGICASIATVIMCACETVKMNRSAFCMIHNCWAVVQGDSEELRKQADVMEKMNDAMLSFYRSKFDLTDEELKGYMDEETWFSGSEAQDFKFKCEVVEDESEFKMAAKFDLSRFHKIPEALNMKQKAQAVAEDRDEEKKVEETVVEEETTVEEPEKIEEVVEEKTEEETTEKKDPEEDEPEEVLNKDEVVKKFKEYEDTIEELKKRCAELEEELRKKEDDTPQDTITKDEADRRVSGMQASMQKQVNDFKGQLQAKEEELISAKAEITSLRGSLEKSNSELSVMASTLEEKTRALDMLNANVNAQAEAIPTMEEGLAKCASPAEKVAFLKSGKYIK